MEAEDQRVEERCETLGDDGLEQCKVCLLQSIAENEVRYRLLM